MSLESWIDIIAGTKIGGQRAAATNKLKYGEDFYSRIAAIGGSRSSDGGFASKKVGRDGLTGRERASKVGKIGGERGVRPAKAVKD